MTILPLIFILALINMVNISNNININNVNNKNIANNQNVLTKGNTQDYKCVKRIKQISFTAIDNQGNYHYHKANEICYLYENQIHQ